MLWIKCVMIEDMGYDNLVISIKSSDVMMCVKAHELIAEQIRHPLHVGITEAGTIISGNIKSSIGLGLILNQGIGDTIRVSLTGDPLEEIKSAKLILRTLGLRKGGIEVVSCPTCGRTRINLIELANQVENMVADIPLDIKVAVMGCVVNGPGEAKEADIGIAGGVGEGLIIKHGQIDRKVPENQLLSELEKGTFELEQGVGKIMAKLFFEVFPTLKITGEMSALLKETEITKVASNSAQNALRIYLESTRLIPKPEIYHIEQEIRQQLFPHKEVAVKIIEKFNLSSQYTPEKLMAVYRESILEEIRNYSVLLYNLMRCSKMEFDREDHMILTLEDTIVATERSNELIDILEKIICERCGLKLMIESQYEKPAENNYLKSADSQIETEVAHIVARTAAARTQNTDGMEQPAIKEAEVQRNAEAAKTEKVPAVQEKNQTTGAEGTGAVPAAGKNNFSGGKDFKGKSSFQRRDFVKKSDNPDVIYGRDFEEDAIPIETIVGEMGEVVIRGQIMTLDTREIRGEKTIIIMSVTDFTDSIVLKIFTKNENLPELMGDLKKGAFLKIKGVTTIDKFDSELTIGSIVGIKKIPDFTTIRMDNSPLKRVELHCHTKMSDMDGVTDVGDLVKRAYKWGHKALAITDHGNVQAFPIANHALPDDPDFKIIYGVEAYLVDDLKDIVENSKNQSLQDTYVVFDIETTGFSPLVNKIIEIGAVKVEKGNITERFSTFVNPEVPIPFHIENLTGIKDDMVITAPVIAEVMPEFLAFCDGAVMVAHNADFDMSFIKYNCDRLSIPYDFTIADTVAMARMLLPNLNRFKLDTVARALNISLENHHRAVDDAACTAEIFEKFVKMLADRGINTLDELNAEGHVSKETVMKMPTHHAIILATNQSGSCESL